MTDPLAIYEQADRRKHPRGHSISEFNQLYVFNYVVFKDGKVIVLKEIGGYTWIRR